MIALESFFSGIDRRWAKTFFSGIQRERATITKWVTLIKTILFSLKTRQLAMKQCFHNKTELLRKKGKRNFDDWKNKQWLTLNGIFKWKTKKRKTTVESHRTLKIYSYNHNQNRTVFLDNCFLADLVMWLKITIHFCSGHDWTNGNFVNYKQKAVFRRQIQSEFFQSGNRAVQSLYMYIWFVFCILT